jgi:exopolysaccharide biosynthesis protein
MRRTLSLLILCLPVLQSIAQCRDKWARVADGVDYRSLDCPTKLHLVRIDPTVAKLDAVLQSNRTAEEVARSGRFLFAINANFFDEQGKPIGVVTSNGSSLGESHAVSWQAVFAVGKDGRLSISPATKSAPRNTRAAVQAGPRLIAGGKRIKAKRASPNLRSGVCIDGAKRAIFFVTPRNMLFDVAEMADLAAGLGCHDAMLFDGGRSAQMYAAGAVSIEGDSRVPVWLVIRQ